MTEVRHEPFAGTPGARISSQLPPAWLVVLLAKDGLAPASHCRFHTLSGASSLALNRSGSGMGGDSCTRLTVIRLTHNSGGLDHSRKSEGPFCDSSNRASLI